jgi:hypothetical protein
MANTLNYNLYKPNRVDNEPVDTTLATNFEIIDTEIKNRKDDLDTHQASTTAHDSENITHESSNVKQAFVDVNNRIDGVDTTVSLLDDRVDNIIAQSGTSDTEVVDARGTFPILRDRLTDIDSSLAEIAYNPRNFNCKLDGVTDDSAALQALFDNPVVQGKVKFPPNAQILLNTPVYINKDNLEIDFNHCQIKWGNANNLGSDAQNRLLGVFNLSKAAETVIGTPTSCVPKIVNNDGSNGTVHSGRYYAKVTMPSAPTGVSVGDWIRVAMTVSGTQVASALIPYFNVVAKCVKINGNDIYFDYFNPFNFNGATYSFARVYKITPRHNVKIKNVNFYDINTWDYKIDDDSTIPVDTLQRTISLIYASGCVDCEFENIYANNTTNPVISLQMSAYCKVNNLEVDRPAITSPGRGYGIQVGASTQIEIDGVHGNYARHCVDFDNCSFVDVKHVNGRYMYATSFMTHGEYDHDITFERCEGSASFNAGISFGAATKNMTFRNCFINEFEVGYSPDLKFYESEVTILPTVESSTYPDYWNRAEFHDCKVSMVGGNWKAINRTGDDTRTFLKFFNCEVSYLNWDTSGATLRPSFLNFDDVLFDTCEIKDADNITNSTANQIVIQGVKNFTVIGGKLRSVYFVIYGSTTDAYLDLDGTECVGYNVPSGQTYSIIDYSYNSNKQLIKLNRMKVVYSGVGTLRVIRTGGTVNNNKNQKFVCNNGYFKSITANLLSFFVPTSSGVVTNNTYMSGNVFVNTNKEGFTTTDFPNNMWVTE